MKSALDLLQSWKAPNKEVDHYFADFLVLGIKIACGLLGRKDGACPQSWLEYQTIFQKLYQEFGKVGVADASFYVLEKTKSNESITCLEKPTMAYFTTFENDVLERLAEGQFSAHWMMMKQIMDIRRLFMPIAVASLAENDRQCAICHEELGSDTDTQSKSCKPEQPVKLPCGHVFGKRCMMAWLLHGTDEATCPACRVVIFEEEFALQYNEDPGQLEVSPKIYNKAIEMLFSRPKTVGGG